MLEDAYHEVLITVIIPVYNGEAFIASAIRSALNQTHRGVDVIVVDDGSSDDTLERVRAIQDRRLRVLVGEGAGQPRGQRAGARVLQ